MEGLIEVLSGKCKVEDVVLPGCRYRAAICLPDACPIRRAICSARCCHAVPWRTSLSKTYDLIILDACRLF